MLVRQLRLRPGEAPHSGADHDVVYLSGANQYNENNYVFGPIERPRGAAVDRRRRNVHGHDRGHAEQHYPVALHPDHHALVTNPQQLAAVLRLRRRRREPLERRVRRRLGRLRAPPKCYTATRLAFCQLVLSRVPERLEAINKGLRTLHFYQIEYNRNDPESMAGGTQDNGSWETIDGDFETWMNINIADGGHNAFDAPAATPSYPR